MESDMLDPEMPDQQLRLHMGELTGSEMLVARAAIRLANSVILSQYTLTKKGT